MRIVLFINGLSSGGAEHQLCELANGLFERGHDVNIVTFSDVEDQYQYCSNIKRVRIAPGRSNLKKLIGIWKFFLSIKVDWIISFGQRANMFCLMPLLFRSRRRAHVVVGERSLTINQPKGRTKWLFDYLYRRADYIVPNSHAQRRKIIELKPQYSDKTITITNFTDLKTYHPTPLPNNKVVRIAVFGRYDKSKNYSRFVEAIRILKQQTNKDFVVEWFGNQHFKDTQPNPLYIEMKHLVENNKLEGTLILNDHTKDVVSEMNRFDAVCLPSLWEGFSNALGEAICCGRPCIASNVGDNPVMVKDGVNGFLFNPQKESEIVNAFMRFFSLTSEESQRMGDESRMLAEELFNRKRFVDSYEKLMR